MLQPRLEAVRFLLLRARVDLKILARSFFHIGLITLQIFRGGIFTREVSSLVGISVAAFGGLDFAGVSVSVHSLTDLSADGAGISADAPADVESSTRDFKLSHFASALSLAS